MRIDLHTHSRVSDGTDAPADLVRAASAAGLDVLALTDHDTAAGWDEAATAAEQVGITLVRGMEVSTRHQGRGVHLLAYLPDPTYPPLQALLDKVLDGRSGRVPAIVAALREHGVAVTEADVHAASGHAAAAGRPHVADALVTLGHVTDRTQAFRELLDPGRPGYVNRWAAPLLETIAVVRAAGGVSVVAHPWGRRGRSALDPETIAALHDHGLSGIEVDHQDHDAASREELRGIARDLDLVVTGSSDHHGLGKVDHELGVNTTAPDQLERLLALAAEAAAASGRAVPPVLRP